MPPNNITRDDVEARFGKLIEKDYRNTAVNGLYGTLKTMLIEAAARKLIDNNPDGRMGRPVNGRREIAISAPPNSKNCLRGKDGGQV